MKHLRHFLLLLIPSFGPSGVGNGILDETDGVGFILAEDGFFLLFE